MNLLEQAAVFLLTAVLLATAAERAVSLFRRHDEQQLEVQCAVRHDEATLVQSAREAAEQLRELFEADALGAQAGFTADATRSVREPAA
ncbi:MAG: hypothetical protein IT514_08200 [Burkholderiales bacterium]|nr:hypothetical protein [Burkholderiales bacterium]